MYYINDKVKDNFKNEDYFDGKEYVRKIKEAVKTKDIKSQAKQADIIISAIGKPKYLSADFIKKDAIIIDVGISRTQDGISGDVDFEKVKYIASYITPVPGGVGPMTIAMLMENTFELYQYQRALIPE